MRVMLAGNDVPGSGHHHLLVDVAEPIALNRHIHFGEGETQAMIDLPPGRHTLELVLANAKHDPLKPLVGSKKLAIWVLEDE
jgi:hypothetical protein